MEPQVDLALHPPRKTSETTMICNHLLRSTAEQLNEFANKCEEKLIHMHHRMLRLETGVKLLEIKLGSVPASEPAKLDAATIASCQVAQDVSPTQARLQAEVAKLGITTSKFWRVRSDYYDQALEWRRDVLGAASTTQLCKSMIMENTKVGDLSFEEVMSKGRVKYVCVVLQYAGAKLNKEKLTDAFRAMEGEQSIHARTHAATAQKWHAHPLRSQLTCSRLFFLRQERDR